MATLVIAAASSTGCKRAGLCEPCAENRDCSGFLVCAPIVTAGPREGNACKPREETKRPGAVLPDPVCPADCDSDCRNLGKCTLRGNECFIEKDADCKNANVCKQYGLCTFVATAGEDYCTAKTDADCTASRVCREEGRCQAYAPGMGLRGCGASPDAGAQDAAAKK